MLALWCWCTDQVKKVLPSLGKPPHCYFQCSPQFVDLWAETWLSHCAGVYPTVGWWVPGVFMQLLWQGYGNMDLDLGLQWPCVDLQTSHSYSQRSHVSYSFPSYKQWFLKAQCFCALRWDNYENPPQNFYQNTHSLLDSFLVSCCLTAAVSSRQGSFISVKGKMILVKEISTLPSPIALSSGSRLQSTEMGKVPLACKTPWDPAGWKSPVKRRHREEGSSSLSSASVLLSAPFLIAGDSPEVSLCQEPLPCQRWISAGRISENLPYVFHCYARNDQQSSLPR